MYDDPLGWHNQFRQQITNRIDEEIFKPLFNETTGAPNAPIRILVAMMSLKEGMGISDEQLAPGFFWVKKPAFSQKPLVNLLNKVYT